MEGKVGNPGSFLGRKMKVNEVINLSEKYLPEVFQIIKEIKLEEGWTLLKEKNPKLLEFETGTGFDENNPKQHLIIKPFKKRGVIYLDVEKELQDELGYSYTADDENRNFAKRYAEKIFLKWDEKTGLTKK